MELPEQKSRAIATPDGAVFCTAEVSSAAGLSKWPEGFWGLSRCWALLHHTCARAQAHTGARTHARARTHTHRHTMRAPLLCYLSLALICLPHHLHTLKLAVNLILWMCVGVCFLNMVYDKTPFPAESEF